MKHYRLSADGTWIDKATGKPMVAPERICNPMVIKDVTYKSPLSGQEITSRSQRREEMKRHNVREVDPSEHQVTYESKARAEKARRDHKPREKVDLGEGYQRLTKAELPKHIAKTIA